MRTSHVLAFSSALILMSAAASAQLSIPWSTIDCGGGTSSGGSFTLSGTIGQPDAGAPMTGGTFTLTGGFWAGISTAPSCAAEFNGDGTLNADDLGDYITCYFGVPPCPQAEFNHDGSLNADDLGDYITAYFAGC